MIEFKSWMHAHLSQFPCLEIKYVLNPEKLQFRDDFKSTYLEFKKRKKKLKMNSQMVNFHFLSQSVKLD